MKYSNAQSWHHSWRLHMVSVMNQSGYRCSRMQAPSGYVTKTDMTHMEISCFSLGPISKTYIIYMQILQTFFKNSKTKAFWVYALREGTLHLPLSTGTCRPLKHPWVPALFSTAVSQMRKVWFEQNNFILQGDEILHIPGSHSLNEEDMSRLLWQPKMVYPNAFDSLLCSQGIQRPRSMASHLDHPRSLLHTSPVDAAKRCIQPSILPPFLSGQGLTVSLRLAVNSGSSCIPRIISTINHIPAWPQLSLFYWAVRRLKIRTSFHRASFRTARAI